MCKVLIIEWIGGLTPDFTCFTGLTTQLAGSSYKTCDLHSERIHYFESRLHRDCTYVSFRGIPHFLRT